MYDCYIKHSAVSEDSINTTVGYFSDSRSQSCHSFTVEYNTVAERNGMVLLTIDASILFPANTNLSVPVATVTVENDDGETFSLFLKLIFFVVLFAYFFVVVKVRMSASSISIDEGAVSTITVAYNDNEVEIGGDVTVDGEISAIPGSAGSDIISLL